ncbi:MAG: hypothetical protein D6717_06495 [Gammaproteobacteria bacterium]|nr:MAG: hypothetical protein D6717_06495 [Gammaproteobacteria bacterium]
MRLPGRHRALLDELLAIAERLYAESEGFLERPDDAQLWYNRGYAYGILRALDALGYAPYFGDRMQRVDAEDIISGHELMPWGKAWQHGLEMGEKETREVLAPAPGRGSAD